ncbi:MAG TPA: hypothetical protein VJK54_00885, partial [Chthoniobacterales bacterium]|nr:hypothetical protein [Chthoniobacterales bacterium]
YGAEKQEDGRVVCEIALWNKLVDSGKQLYCAVRQLEKATEAKNNGNSEIATFYLQLAEQEQVLGEHYKKAVQRFYNVFSTYEVAESARARDRLSNAADLLDKATEAKSQGNPEIVTLYLQLAEQEQALAEHHRKAAIDCLEKNVANAALDKAAKSAEASGDRLCRVACKLDEATEAKSQGNLEIATLLQFTEQEQASSLEYLKAAQAYAEGNNEEGDQLFQAAEEVAKGKSY